MFKKIALCETSQMESVQKKRFVIGDEKIMLAKIENTFYAIEDTCSHAEASLTAGILDGFQIECPRHGARFDVRSGEVVTLPAVMPLKTYPVTVEEGQIVISLEESGVDKVGCADTGGCTNCNCN
jgi:3-phenylpropionate/trans-cinnamate dioxygenase ferredoxin subunit